MTTDPNSNPVVPQKILFIGNSYTYYNDLDIVLKKLAASARPSVKFLIARIAEGSATLETHYNNPATLAKIRNMKWDIVILQEQSFRPIEDVQAFYAFARKLDAVIKDSGARTVFYMTWARQNKPEMTEPLNKAYTQMGRQLGALVAPVGLAYVASLKSDPAIPLYIEDGSHPTPQGTYLAACVFYATLTGRSPVGLSTAGMKELTPPQARSLQETAWTTVQDYMKTHREKQNPQATNPNSQAVPKH
jgi:hypothetical protein